MDTDKAEGTVQELVGKGQDVLGAALGDTATQVSGKARELSGKAQQLCADTTSIVRDKTAASPFAALGIMAFVGFLVGVMWSRSGNNSSSHANPRSDRTSDRED